jgi:hypothetical protein
MRPKSVGQKPADLYRGYGAHAEGIGMVESSERKGPSPAIELGGIVGTHPAVAVDPLAISGTRHNIPLVTRRDSLYGAAIDRTPKNVNFAPESS